MTGTAILGTEDVVFPGHGRLEPGLGIAAGDDVHLDPESRNIEGMDDVDRGHQQLNRTTGRNVEILIHVSVGIGETPVPFLPRDLNLIRVGWRRRNIEITLESEKD